MKSVNIACKCCGSKTYALYDGQFATCSKCGYVREVTVREDGTTHG